MFFWTDGWPAQGSYSPAPDAGVSAAQHSSSNSTTDDRAVCRPVTISFTIGLLLLFFPPSLCARLRCGDSRARRRTSEIQLERRCPSVCRLTRRRRRAGLLRVRCGVYHSRKTVRKVLKKLASHANGGFSSHVHLTVKRGERGKSIRVVISKGKKKTCAGFEKTLLSISTSRRANAPQSETAYTIDSRVTNSGRTEEITKYISGVKVQ